MMHRYKRTRDLKSVFLGQGYTNIVREKKKNKSLR